MKTDRASRSSVQIEALLEGLLPVERKKLIKIAGGAAKLSRLSHADLARLLATHRPGVKPHELLTKKKGDDPVAAPTVSNRRPIYDSTVTADLEKLVQGGKHTATETEVMELIQRWQHGDIKSIGHVAVAIARATKQYGAELAAGKDRLKEFASGKGGGGVIPKPLLEKKNRKATDTDELTWYENIAGKLHVSADPNVDFDRNNDAQGDEGNCFDIAVLRGTPPERLGEMGKEEQPISKVIEWAKTLGKNDGKVAFLDVLKAQLARCKKDGADEPTVFLWKVFEPGKHDPDVGTPVWMPVDHEFAVGTDHRPKFASTKNGALWLEVAEMALALQFGAWSKIDGGDSAESMLRRFGVRGRTFTIAKDFPDDAQFVAFVQKCKKEGRVLTTGTLDAPEAPEGGDAPKAARKVKGDGPAPGTHVDHPLATGIVPDHEYTLLDIVESGGKYWVKVSNPWDDTVPPASNDPSDPGKSDKEMGPGDFYLTLEDYRANYEDLSMQRFRKDPPLPKADA